MSEGWKLLAVSIISGLLFCISSILFFSLGQTIYKTDLEIHTSDDVIYINGFTVTFKNKKDTLFFRNNYEVKEYIKEETYNKISMYRKKPIYNYVKLGLYPVYVEDIYNGREPFKVVGIRENQIELQGDYSGGTHNVNQKSWIDIDKCFVISKVCLEQEKDGGCQVHNVNCCGGEKIVSNHVYGYWNNLVE